MNMFSQEKSVVNVLAKEYEKANTRRAYDSKQIEFIEFCKHVYAKHDDWETITETKVYGFMLYQCHRASKKGQGEKWKEGTPRFCSHDYDNVLDSIKNGEVKTKNLLQFSMIKAYLCSIQYLLHYQNEEKIIHLKK